MSTATTASALVPKLAQYIKGKTILVLGASPNSLGAKFLDAIKPAEPGLVILGGRTPAKLEATVGSLRPIPTETFTIDMLSFASVREAADEINAHEGNIDVVVNSAGSMASPYYKSSDGFESQLQINHLGFFLFTNLIMERLLASRARIVNVSSEGYSAGPLRYYDYNFHDGDVYNPFAAYGQAKTAQILFASGLATRLGGKGLRAYSIQPGHTQGTNLHDTWGDYTIKDMVEHLRNIGIRGAWDFPGPSTLDSNLANYVLAAFDPELEKDNGAYIRQGQVVPLDDMYSWAVDERQQRRCWKLSEELVGQEFRYD